MGLMHDIWSTLKDSHLTIRLPGELAQALAQWARARGVPKSAVAREAVARYLARTPSTQRTVTAGELADAWGSLPRLTPDEAKAFAADITGGRKILP